MRFPIFNAAVFAILAGIACSAAKGQTQDDGGSTSALNDLVETGRALFDEFVPEDVREQYAFPDEAAVEQFLADMETAFAEGSFEQLAAYAPAAQNALRFLRAFEGGEDLADWLEPRLDYLIAAGEVDEATSAPPPAVRARPKRPGESITPPPKVVAPAPAKPVPKVAERSTGKRSREYWQRAISKRPPPVRARELVPSLKRVFREAGVPPECVWIAEVESSMNPKARSPAGARGLFQFMPATAERFGLRTSWPDERLDPEKSARAAAEYLRFLHGKFRSWPLALAAYNSGEGRVGRLLKGDRKSFESIQPLLPAETQFYVPKVLATIAVREQVDPDNLPAPRTARIEQDARARTIVARR
ncbi:MAG: lytic transglycosylase domain-containing protein [Opitutaceae bacterium]